MSRSTLVLWFTFVFLLGLNATPALSGAKPTPPSGSCDGNPSGPTTPTPVRKVRLQPIGTKAFQLPNGSGIDFSADLQSILNTAVTSTSSFSPVDYSFHSHLS